MRQLIARVVRAVQKLPATYRANALYALGGVVVGLAIGLIVGGHSRPADRFVNDGARAFLALDTKTGQECVSYAPADYSGRLPVCHDLYLGKSKRDVPKPTDPFAALGAQYDTPAPSDTTK